MIPLYYFLVYLALRAYAWTRPNVTIILNSERYMKRYFLTGKRSEIQAALDRGETGFPGTYLQRIYRADADRRLHNHPWLYAHSRIVRGWYKEASTYLDGTLVHRTYRTGDENFLTPAVFHRITSVSPGGVWTWFTAGPKTGKGWGFR